MPGSDVRKALSVLTRNVNMERRCMCGPEHVEAARELAQRAGATVEQIEEAMK